MKFKIQQLKFNLNDRELDEGRLYIVLCVMETLSYRVGQHEERSKTDLIRYILDVLSNETGTSDIKDFEQHFEILISYMFKVCV